MEKVPKIEQIGENREKLLSLEKDGAYVFHGSPDIIKILKPRQAFNHNNKTGQMEKDDELAVFATPYSDVAIFRALINTKNISGESTSQFGINDGELHFSATKNLLKAARKKVGRVYVLDKQKFQNFKSIQCCSKKSIEPIEVIEVSIIDLPKKIEVIDKKKVP